ncbi:hypothetical protein D050_2604B, partial [Vibrio parahaemolyticus VPCR-2009]
TIETGAWGAQARVSCLPTGLHRIV